MISLPSAMLLSPAGRAAVSAQPCVRGGRAASSRVVQAQQEARSTLLREGEGCRKWLPTCFWFTITLPGLVALRNDFRGVIFPFLLLLLAANMICDFFKPPQIWMWCFSGNRGSTTDSFWYWFRRWQTQPETEHLYHMGREIQIPINTIQSNQTSKQKLEISDHFSGGRNFRSLYWDECYLLETSYFLFLCFSYLAKECPGRRLVCSSRCCTNKSLRAP